jgi:hypothetical protein
MGQDVVSTDVVEAITRTSVESAEHLLRTAGLCPPPVVHVLSRHLASPYIGSVTTRPFYRGADAAAAVTALGLLPSLLCATQLVIAWEYADLCTALELPGPAGFPTALVVVYASLDDHVLGWHPFDLRIGPPGPSGIPTAAPEWGKPERYPGAPLPEPVAELLALWREWRPSDVHATARELAAPGSTLQRVVADVVGCDVGLVLR